MGLDIHCCAVVGVRCERITKTREKTKYNQDTGDPYTAIEEYKVVQVIGSSVEIDPYSESLFCCDNASDSGWFFGVEIARSNSYDSKDPWFVLPDNIINESSKALELLESVGCNVSPQIFIYKHFSY